MRRLLIIFLILLASVWLGLQINHDPGYVLLANHRWTVELPLWLAALLVFLSFTLFYFGLRLISKTTAIPRNIKHWLKRRQIKLAYRRTLRGLSALIEGRWQAAEKTLLRAHAKKEAALINYLGAAYAASQQNALERCEEYLQKARLNIPQAALTISIVEAQLSTPEQAVIILQSLYETYPQQTQVLKLLQQIYTHQQAWEKLEELIPALYKHKLLSAAKLVMLEQQIYQGLLQRAAKHQDNQNLSTIWQRIPRHMRSNIEIIKAYVQGLLVNQASSEAELLLRETLKKNWNSDLAYYFGLVEGKNLDQQLATAEQWLHEHKDDAALLLSLGRLCMRKQLWGKARSYFESSLNLQATAECFAALARLHEQLGDIQLANDYYRKGLLACLPTLSV